MKELNVYFYFLIVLFFSSSLMAALPYVGDAKHMGVASCGSSTCHGAISEYKVDSNILRNEYVTWSRYDAHSRSMETLYSNESNTITQKLGLKKAYEEKICLDCHVSNIIKANQGRRFQISDGVGCESCHGGAEHWLVSHTKKNTSHEDNISNGLYPLDNPVKRAELCLSCHQGNRNQYVTHLIMGAGHPRLSFELDTFTATQPAHYRVDQDYIKRKKEPVSIQSWWVGQLVSAKLSVDQLAHSLDNFSGMFPELSLFDCYSCHHDMSKLRWQNRKSIDLPPGSVPLNDANFVIIQNVLKVIAPVAEKKFSKHLKSLQNNIQSDRVAVKKILYAMEEQFRGWIKTSSEQYFNIDETRGILFNLTKGGGEKEYPSYSSAEQVAMGVVVLLAELQDQHVFSKESQFKVKSAIDKMFHALREDESYQQKNFSSTLKNIQQLVDASYKNKL